MHLEKLVAVHKITEYKDGSVFRTQFLEERWVPLNASMYKINENDEQYCSLSTSRSKELGSLGTIRSVR